jgi:hypothetical protein
MRHWLAIFALWADAGAASRQRVMPPHDFNAHFDSVTATFDD